MLRAKTHLWCGGRRSCPCAARWTERAAAGRQTQINPRLRLSLTWDQEILSHTWRSRAAAASGVHPSAKVSQRWRPDFWLIMIFPVTDILIIISLSVFFHYLICGEVLFLSVWLTWMFLKSTVTSQRTQPFWGSLYGFSMFTSWKTQTHLHNQTEISGEHPSACTQHPPRPPSVRLHLRRPRSSAHLHGSSTARVSICTRRIGVKLQTFIFVINVLRTTHLCFHSDTRQVSTSATPSDTTCWPNTAQEPLPLQLRNTSDHFRRRCLWLGYKL